MHRSLGTRIILWSFVPTAIILLAVALMTYYAYQQVTEELVVERSHEVTRLSAAQLAAEISEYSDILTSLARTPALYRGSPVGSADALRQARHRLAVFDAGVVMLGPRGEVTAAEPSRYEILNQDWSDRPYFREVLRMQTTAFSDLTNDGPLRSEVVVVAVPVTGEQGEFAGALLGMFRLGANSVSAFYGDLVKLRVGSSGSSYLVDGNGRLLFHGDPALVGSDFRSEYVVQELLGGRTGAVRAQDVRGQEIVAGYSPVPGTGWGLVAEESWEALRETGQDYRRFLLLLLALGIVVPTLVVHFGVKRLTRPIIELGDAAQRVASGDFGHSISVPTGDELEELAVQFNRMSAELKESYTELERRVASRTRELATLNAITRVVSRSLDLDRILADALEKTLEATETESGAAFRVEGEELVLMARQGISAGLAGSLANTALGWLGSAAAAGGEVVLRGRDESEQSGALLDGSGFRLLAAVPLGAKGRLLGLICLLTERARDLTPDELSLLRGIGGQVGVAIDNARLYEQAEQSAAAAERSRLARDLHDAVSQTLFSTTLIAEVLPKIWERNPEEGRRRLEELRQLTRGALAEMRALLLELRPAALAEAELPDLLRQLAESVTGRARIPVVVEVGGECCLPVEAKVAFYRVAQEALNNVVKHAAASSASLALVSQGGEVRLRVADDGQGFDPAAVGPYRLGLGIMRERAEAVGGSLQVKSTAGGTEVLLTWGSDLPDRRELY